MLPLLDHLKAFKDRSPPDIWLRQYKPKNIAEVCMFDKYNSNCITMFLCKIICSAACINIVKE